MAEERGEGQLSEGGRPGSLVFDYIKSTHFRVVHVDGAVGGTAPTGLIFVNFYNERAPIPQRQVFAVRNDFTLGDEILSGRVSRPGVVREVETAVVMDVNTAKRVVEWLNKVIETTERLREKVETHSTIPSTTGGPDA